jgi:UDP-glucuronate 4-epimerase
LRFFTVYGPWGRPDMALFKFTRAIIAGQPIQLFNGGNMARDFTYIDDIADAILRVAERPPQENPAWDAMRMDPATSSAPWRMLNIGSNRPVQLIDYVRALEKALGKKAQIEFLPMQSGDVPATHADVSELEALTDFRPVIPVETGVGRFVAWYREFYAE